MTTKCTILTKLMSIYEFTINIRTPYHSTHFEHKSINFFMFVMLCRF